MRIELEKIGLHNPTRVTEETISKLNQQIIELKKQLKSQPAEIIDKIKACYKPSIYTRPEAHTKIIVLFSRLDNILKEYQKQ